jgi:hypothetical protein
MHPGCDSEKNTKIALKYLNYQGLEKSRLCDGFVNNRQLIDGFYV